MAAQNFTAEIAYILGRGARRVARGWRQCEHYVADRLVANGVAPPAAQLLFDGAKFAALGAFFFLASWLATLVAFAIAASWVAANTADARDAEETEWREGHSGFGLYDKSDWRVDMPGPGE